MTVIKIKKKIVVNNETITSCVVVRCKNVVLSLLGCSDVFVGLLCSERFSMSLNGGL